MVLTSFSEAGLGVGGCPTRSAACDEAGHLLRMARDVRDGGGLPIAGPADGAEAEDPRRGIALSVDDPSVRGGLDAETGRKQRGQPAVDERTQEWGRGFGGVH